MGLFLGLLVIGLLLLPLVRGLWLATELFRVRADQGVVTLERGRLPPSLFTEIADIARRERLSGVVRAVLAGGSPRLILQAASGTAAEQPLRNVLGRFTVAQLRAGSLRAK